MKYLIWPALVAGLLGCAALPQIGNVITGTAEQQTAKGPLYNYRADLLLGFDGKVFEGMGATLLTGPKDIQIISKVDLDRIQVTSCARQDVCQAGAKCPNFQIDSDWFGQAGKTAIYNYTPNKKELEGLCPIYIEAFQKSGLAAWGFIGFRSDEKLQGKLSCNGVDWTFAGFSVCQTKGGLDQSLAFQVDILDQEAEKSCNMKQIDSKHFDFRPDNGFCRASFFDGVNWHRMVMLGYDEVLVRGQ